MADLLANAADEQLTRFATRFLNQYAAQGFQSLSKRDVDLLLFYELELSGIVDPNASNHDVARKLRLTPKRVSALRRDAWARWARQNEITEHLKRSLAGIFEQQALTTLLEENKKRWREDGLVPVLLEHPSDRAELEELLKSRHSVPLYARNHEVLLVPHAQLLAIAELLSGKLGQDRLERIQRALGSDSDLKNLLTTDLGKLSWAKARSALGAVLAELVQKLTVELAAKGLSAIFRAFFV